MFERCCLVSGLIEYKCPCCGGAIEFSSQLQKMKCPYCDQEFDVETLQKYDEELKQKTEDKTDWNESDYKADSFQIDEETGMAIYVCDSCGGEIIAEQTTAAMSCPYCSNPVVMKGQLSGELKPDVIIPFKLDKEAAKKAYKSLYINKRLVPNIFVNENHINELKGIYVPFWLYSCDAYADVAYKTTKVSAWNDVEFDYMDTSHYRVNRSGNLTFKDVPADGSSKMPDDLMDAIEPYDFTEIKPFQTAYLAGYLADRYDMDSSACEQRANARIQSSTRSTFDATVTGYASVDVEDCNIQYQNKKVRYGLLPVWLLKTTCDGKEYTFAMNGQTGKMIGDLPVSKTKYNLSVAAITAAVAAVLYLIIYLLAK